MRTETRTQPATRSSRRTLTVLLTSAANFMVTLDVAAGLSLLGAMVAIGMGGSSKTRVDSEHRQEAPMAVPTAIPATQTSGSGLH